MEENIAKAVLAVLENVYEKSPWTLEQIISDLSQETTEYFYYYSEGQLVGFLSIQQLIGEVEITNIAVRKSHQGLGIADKLMKTLADREETMFLEVRESNHKAQTLYTKYGFECVGNRKNYYHDPIEDAIIMRREGYDR